MVTFVEEFQNEWDNPYLYWWLLASAVSSVYAYTWDIKMDWGLLDKHAGENTFLREEIVYTSTVSGYFKSRLIGSYSVFVYTKLGSN